MTTVPEHVEATVTCTTTYRCTRCGARVTPGQYVDPATGARVLTAWLERHQHDDDQEQS